MKYLILIVLIVLVILAGKEIIKDQKEKPKENIKYRHVEELQF